MTQTRFFLAILLSFQLAVLTGCSKSDREFTEPTETQISSEAKKYLSDFVAKSRQTKKLNAADVEPVLESLAGYRETMGEKIEPVVAVANRLKSEIESSSSPKKIKSTLDEFEQSLQQL
ncbi:MAG: hypothetical protein HUJ26_02740 [Planctomycetaceae bacterium]|nr:hypothetical protein [Planctomycetaceae bacterium]